MKDMTTVLNKKIVNKETNEVRLVVKIDEENRKIFSVPASEPTAEPTGMAAASYDRRWRLCEEQVTETAAEPQTEEPKTEAPAAEDKPEPMKMSETITALETIFDKLNAIYFEGKLPRPVITVQTTPKAYGHCSTKKIWKSENEGMYEINLAPSSSIARRNLPARPCCMKWSTSSAPKTRSLTPARMAATTTRPSRPSARAVT